MLQVCQLPALRHMPGSLQFSRRQARRSKSKATHEALLAIFRGVDCDSFLALFGAKAILDIAMATNQAEQIQLFAALREAAQEVCCPPPLLACLPPSPAACATPGARAHQQMFADDREYSKRTARDDFGRESRG